MAEQQPSRFAPTESELGRMVIAANDRAERLARRILAAEKAIKQGSPSSVVLAILGGE